MRNRRRDLKGGWCRRKIENIVFADTPYMNREGITDHVSRLFLAHHFRHGAAGLLLKPEIASGTQAPAAQSLVLSTLCNMFKVLGV